MSLDTEIRRDANPTPTRFLLECGAFTPGLSLNLDNYNPFDASLKFLNTGTPKAESNPFDTSFRVPSAPISVLNNTNNNVATPQQKRNPWTDIIFDEVSMPMPRMSPGLSPSSSYSSASPSPPLRSPPTQTISLTQFHPSMAIDPHATQSQPYEHVTDFENLATTEELHHSNADVAPQTQDSDCYNSNIRKISENDEHDQFEHNQDIDEYDEHYEQGLDNRRRSGGIISMAAAMSALDMRRLSTLSDIQSSGEESYADRSVVPKASKAPKSKKAASSSKSSTGSRKGKDATTKSGSRKRTSSEEETPESKRQKFLERNRMAASKCREKKRLQTLKTISDADEITARNQALHETLDQLQEEVRHLKNQILSHRDCGCDVIQKFVQTSFDFTAQSSAAPVYVMPQSSVPPMQLY
ncbi:hypothetical protein BGX27_006494 [Mortierella sp. AM989]|nr:hypothetical protein BGX27_006494 [Mortierella sp. AM989]